MNCHICGDPGFADCLFICNQCNEVAEHVYCMLRPPESDDEASWSCEDCKLKQKTISQTMAISSLSPQVQQSPERVTKRQREGADTYPVNRKQIIEISKGMDSYLFSKKQACSNSKCEPPVQGDSPAIALKPEGGDSYIVSQEMHISLQSDVPSRIPEARKSECSDNITSAVYNSFLPHLPKKTSVNRLGFKQLSSPTAQISPDLLSAGSKSSDCKQLPARVTKRESVGANSDQFIKTQNPDGSKVINSFQFSTNQSLADSKCESPVQIDNLVVAVDPARAEGYGGYQEMGSSLTSLVPSRIPESGKLECPDTISPLCPSFLPHLPKKTSLNRMGSKESTAQTSPDFLSSGVKSNVSDRSQDPLPHLKMSSELDGLSLARRVLKGSKRIGSGSGQSLIDGKSSDPKTAVECKKQLIELASSSGGLENIESTKYSPKLKKRVGRHKEFEEPEALSLLEMHEEDCRGLTPKGNSSGPSRPSDMNSSNKVPSKNLVCQSNQPTTTCLPDAPVPFFNEIDPKCCNRVLPNPTQDYYVDSAGAINNFKEIDQSQCLKSIWTKGVDRGVEWKSIKYMDKRKLQNQGNVPASESMNNRPLSASERGDMAKRLLSDMNNSNEAAPHQKILNLPESQILWKGSFNVVGVVCGNHECDGIHAHPSQTASPKVIEVTKQFSSHLQLEQVHCAEAWPKRFQESLPTDESIGLYFFPADRKRNESYAKLVEIMVNYDMAMRMHLDGAELLMYSSNKLPDYVQRFNGSFYIWGVFRGPERGAAHHRVQGASLPLNHVGVNILLPDSTSNIKDSVGRRVAIPNVYNNGGGEEDMDVELWGEHDVVISERPLSRLDSHPVGVSTRCISQLLVSRDSEVNCIEQEGDNVGRCASFKQDPSSVVPYGIRYKVSQENVNEDVSRRTTMESINQSHVWNHPSANKEKSDGQLGFNSSASHVLDRTKSRKSTAATPEGNNAHETHQRMQRRELPHRFGSSNRRFILERNDEVHFFGSQVLNRTHSKIHPSFSDCSTYKQRHKHFPGGPGSKIVSRKQKDSRDQYFAFPSRRHSCDRNQHDRHHRSHEFCVSSGESDSSYRNRQYAFSAPCGDREVRRFKDVNRISRSHSFKEVNCRTRREKEDGDERNEAAKRRMDGMGRDYNRRHRHWHERDGTRPQMESHRGNHVLNNRVGSSALYSHKRYMPGKTMVHTDYSSDVQFHNMNFVNTVKNNMDDSFKFGDHGRYLRRTESENPLLSVKEACGNITSEGLKGQHQQNKDQWSFTPIKKSTTEAEENNVSEVSNASSLLESLEQRYYGENNPFEVFDANDSTTVNSRAGHISGCGLDQYPFANRANWYAGSSSEQADLERMPCLELFPLEEENLGMAKEVVNDRDIDLHLGLGRKTLNNRMKQADREVSPNGSNAYPQVDSETIPFLSLSVPLANKKV